MAVITSPVLAGDTLLAGIKFATTGANSITILGDIIDGGAPWGAGALGIGLNLSSASSQWAVTVEGSVGSLGTLAGDFEDGTGIRFGNKDATTASTLTVKAEAGVAGSQFGVYSLAVLNITNSGSIGASENAINYNGDAGGASALNTITSGVAKTILVTNNEGATIQGGINGIANNSEAMLKVINKGYISSADFGFAIDSDGGLNLTNDIKGIVEGNVSFGWTGSSVVNSGKIFGTVNNWFDSAYLDWFDNATPLVTTDDFIALDLDRDGDFGDGASKGAVKYSTVELTTAKNIATNNAGAIIAGQFDYGFDDINSTTFQVALDLNDSTADFVTNKGSILGDVWTGGGKDSLTNEVTATIYGQVVLGTVSSGRDDNDTLVNAGKILGQWDNDHIVKHSGVELGSGNNSVTNSGTIEGNVNAAEGNDKVTNTGTILGHLDLGHGNNELVSNTVKITGPVLAGYGNDKLTSTGIINGDVSIGWDTKQLADFIAALPVADRAAYVPLTQDRDTFTNGGTIFGAVFTGTGDDTITNNGTILNGLNAENGDNNITNNKTIYNGIKTGDADNTPLTVTTFEVEKIMNAATGLVFAGISSGTGHRSITNNGAINGGIKTGLVLTADPPGLDNEVWEAIGAGDDTVTNTKDIIGNIELANGTNKLVNSGYIDGSVVTLSGSDRIENNGGSIKGAVDAGDGANTVINKATIFGEEYNDPTDGQYHYFTIKTGSGFDTIQNTAGTLFGDILAGDGGSQINNTGSLYGRVMGGDGTDTVTNSKLIDDHVFLSTGANDRFDNKTGAIVNGNIFLARHMDGMDESVADGRNSLINAGTINGSVDGGIDIDIITNTKLITGDIYLYGGEDTGNQTVNGVLLVALGDVLDNRTGVIEGRIFMGGGKDTVMGGAGREIVVEATAHFDENTQITTYDGENGLGEDKYELGAGDDYLLGYNDASVDTYDGGVGTRDAIDFTHADAAMTINLTANKLDFAGAGVTDVVKNFEEVFGTTFGDTIIGNDTGTGFAEFLHGDAGADTITGGKGADLLWAGKGQFSNIDGDVDTFIYNAVTDSGTSRLTRDTIYDFDDTMDIINLTVIDADTRVTAINNQDFEWLGLNMSFNGIAGELRAVIRGTQTIIEADTNGDRKIDFSIALDGLHTDLSVANFVGVDD